MDLNKFTVRAQAAITQAQTLAAGNGQQAIETGHLLKGLLLEDNDVTPFLLKKLDVNLNILTQALDRIVQGYPRVQGGQSNVLSRQSADVLTKALASTSALSVLPRVSVRAVITSAALSAGSASMMEITRCQRRTASSVFWRLNATSPR
jgi:ATP-dependent Clp protease ATP-binding subunit ClpA